MFNPAVPPSPGFQRNSPRLSSFGKVEHKSSSSYEEESDRHSVPNGSQSDRTPVNNGIQQRGSVKKPEQKLQYIEVAVNQNSPPANSQGASCAIASKTQYTEVVLSSGDNDRCVLGAPNGYVEEVDLSDEPPSLPTKEHQNKGTAAEDIWVRNTTVPTLPPKARARTKTPNGRQPLEVPPLQVTQPENAATPELLRVEAAKPTKTATPELSRKAYEVMSSPVKETPSPQLSRKVEPAVVTHDQKEPPEKRPHPIQYENVALKGRSVQYPQSMIISDVDQGDSEDQEGYVFISQRSNTVSATGYENVTPSGQAVVKKRMYENVPVQESAQNKSYESMEGAQQQPYEAMQSQQSYEAMQSREDEDTENQGNTLIFILILPTRHKETVPFELGELVI